MYHTLDDQQRMELTGNGITDRSQYDYTIIIQYISYLKFADAWSHKRTLLYL